MVAWLHVIFAWHLFLFQYEWKDCPVFIERDFNKEKPKNLGRKKEFKDGITIHVDSPSQLQIPPHWPKKLRQAREEANKETNYEMEELEKAEKELEEVNREIEQVRLDIESKDGVKMIKGIQRGAGLVNRKEELEKRIEELKKIIG